MAKMKVWKRQDKRASIDRSANEPTPMAVVMGRQPRAALLYYALIEYAAAKGLKEVWLTRRQMARLIGVTRDGTISTALTRLGESAWIVKRVYNALDSDKGCVNRLICVTFHRKFGEMKNYSKQEEIEIEEVEPPEDPKDGMLEIETDDDIPEGDA